MSTLTESVSSSGDHRRRWHLVEGTELLWHTGDEASLVYNTLSGDTHLLDNLSASLLDILNSGEVMESNLVGIAADELSIEPAEAQNVVRQRLHTLEQLELICIIDS